MISIPSFKNFLFINGFMFSIGYLEYYLSQSLNYAIPIEFLIILSVFLLRNTLFVEFIQHHLKNKESIHPRFTKKEDYLESYPHEFALHIFSSTTVETITYLFIKYQMPQFQTQSYQDLITVTAKDILYFIPQSFLFELVFDFFHYWTHRILHSNKFLYTHIHKKHHKFNYTIPILTFYHHPLDLVITNSIPQIITLCIFPSISLFQYNVILSYKTFIEICGHSGKKSYPIGSFSQFIWLPRLFDICLYSEDHALHHSSNFCNYSKRFILWDKQFETYTESIPPKITNPETQKQEPI